MYRELYEPHRKTVDGFDDLIAQARLRGVALAVATAAPNANLPAQPDAAGSPLLLPSFVLVYNSPLFALSWWQ